MHGLENQPSVLRRCAAQSPDTPLHHDWAEFRRQRLEESLKIEKNDPELVSLLDGTAPAGLRADVLQGKFSTSTPEPINPDVQKRQKIQELVASKPYQNGQIANFTAAMMLEDLAHDIAARERKKAGFMSHSDRDDAKREEIEASRHRLQQMEVAGLQSRLNSLTRYR